MAKILTIKPMKERFFMENKDNMELVGIGKSVQEIAVNKNCPEEDIREAVRNREMSLIKVGETLYLAKV